MGVFILTGEFSSVNFVLSTKLEESHSQPEKTMLMRTRTFILCLLALCLSTIRGYASGLGDFRVNARFLTDRMAFELQQPVQRPVRNQLRLSLQYRSIRFWHCRCRHSCNGCILPLPGRTKRRPAMGTFTSRIRTLHRY